MRCVTARPGGLYTARVRFVCPSVPLCLGIALLAGHAFAEDPVAALSLTRPKPVQAAKEFQVATPDKGQVALSSFKGRVVFLNFWATWCKPCEEEMPAMERLYQRFKDRGLIVLAISEDAAGGDVVSQYVKKHNLSFPVGLDPKMSVAGLYGVWAIPSTFIIDKNGKRALAANGPREWDGPQAHALFESLLR
jgi:peroxiredoxin